MIVGNSIGCIVRTPDTVVFQDESGQEYVGTMVDQETIFTAGLNDIRQGKVAAINTGVVTGEKVIPAYHTNEGTVAIPNGSEYKIKSLKHMDLFEYTKLLAVICDYNSNLSNSVASRTVAINNQVYSVLSTIPLSEVTINNADKTIDFGVKNETGKPQILRFITYKEIL